MTQSEWLDKVAAMSSTEIEALGREGAIGLLIEYDVARWGEGEREASRAQHSRKTHGLALNGLHAAVALERGRSAAKALDAASKRYVTGADRASLRSGG